MTGDPSSRPDRFEAMLRDVNERSPFNVWAGFEILAADKGTAELGFTVRAELRQHAGSLHAGVVTAVLDTACGYAAATISGAVVATQVQTLYLAPMTGIRFVARARIIRAGKRQIFASAELFDRSNPDDETLVATATALLVPLAPAPEK